MRERRLEVIEMRRNRMGGLRFGMGACVERSEEVLFIMKVMCNLEERLGFERFGISISKDYVVLFSMVWTIASLFHQDPYCLYCNLRSHLGY